MTILHIQEVINIPSYSYKCTNQKCNHESIITCKMSQYSPTIQCTQCDEPMTRKVDDLLPQNYIVKCDGFYGKKSN